MVLRVAMSGKWSYAALNLGLATVVVPVALEAQDTDRRRLYLTRPIKNLSARHQELGLSSCSASKDPSSRCQARAMLQ